MHKVLIAYASGYGSTAEVAREMGETLMQEGISVTVSQLPGNHSPEQYDAVIVGSAIRYDRWMPAAKEFVINNSATLDKMPVAFFFNCLTLARRSDETEEKAHQYARQLFSLDEKVKPLSVGRFPGVLDYTKMPFFIRTIFKIFGFIAGLQPGDYRDWKEIRQWTKDVEVQFKTLLSQR